MSAITVPIPLESAPPVTIPPGAYYWSRDAAGYLYPTTTTDTVRVNGPTSSATNPSYGFYGTAAALLTGMYYSAANTIAFTSNGTQVGTFSTSTINFPGVTGAAASSGSAVGIASGNGGTSGGGGGQFAIVTGAGSTNAAGTAGAGGAFSITGGNGGAQSTAFVGGQGATVTVFSGSGGANTGAASGHNGGVGGALQISSGNGGATNSTNTNKNGGAGGALAITTGNGGAATGASVAANGGAAGAFSITSGNGGAASGATSTGSGGAGGRCDLAGGSGGLSIGGTGGTGGDATLYAGAAGNSTSGSGGTGGSVDIQSRNGGSSSTSSGGAGGSAQLVSGAGGATASTVSSAGAGAFIQFWPGAGGNNTGAGSGGAGTASGVRFNSANGGSCTNAGSTGNAGSGSPFIVTCGAGGAAVGGNPGTGGRVDLNLGSGGANSGGASGTNGGSAGNFTLTGGTGGATDSTAASKTGGTGTTVTFTTGNGGAATGAAVASVGGAAGAFTVTGGTGGATSGTGAGGIGGVVNLNPGSGGTSVGGTAGNQGRVKIGGTGIFAFANAQSITPSATHTLILTATAAANQSVVSSTFITVASDAAGRKMLLPTEASSNGLYLIFANTSATNTLVLRDSTDTNTIATLAVSSQCEVMCDGTTWYACGFGSASSGVGGYWSRSGTTLSPTTFGDIVTAPVQGVGNQNECFGTASSIGAGGIANTTCGASNTIPLNGGYNTLIGAHNTISVAGGGVQYNTIVGTDCTLSQASVGCLLMGFQSQTIGAGAYADIVLLGGRSCSAYSNFATAVGSSTIIGLTSNYSSCFGYGAVTNNVGSIALGANSDTSAASQCVIGGRVAGQGAITEVLIGNGPNAASPNSPNVEPTQATGTDKNGGSFTLRGGRNTGSGAGGQLLFDIYPAGSTGTTAGTATNMQRVVSTYYNERRAGSGTGFAGIAGRLFQAYTDTTSSGTSAQNLHSFTLIGNTLLHDGDTIVFYSTMALTTLGGNLTVAFRLGTTDLTMFNAAAPAGATQATYTVRCIRTGAATQRVEGTITINATAPYVNTIYTTMAETLSGNLTIANRITATVSGTVTNSITTVDYFPALQT